MNKVEKHWSNHSTTDLNRRFRTRTCPLSPTLSKISRVAVANLARVSLICTSLKKRESRFLSLTSYLNRKTRLDKAVYPQSAKSKQLVWSLRCLRTLKCWVVSTAQLICKRLATPTRNMFWGSYRKKAPHLSPRPSTTSWSSINSNNNQGRSPRITVSREVWFNAILLRFSRRKGRFQSTRKGILKLKASKWTAITTHILRIWALMFSRLHP
jgi:hypothetical protein